MFAEAVGQGSRADEEVEAADNKDKHLGPLSCSISQEVITVAQHPGGALSRPPLVNNHYSIYQFIIHSKGFLVDAFLGIAIKFVGFINQTRLPHK